MIVFDLDDTLYEELSFVRSGYLAVALTLTSICKMTQQDIFNELVVEEGINRKEVFDRFLEKKGLKTKRLVNRCLSIYRGHDPKIKLLPEAKKCLESLNGIPLYVVTDGNNRVQRRKYFALGLEDYTKGCLCTYSYGLHHSKPSPYCFEKICQIEKVSPEEVYYVADNPHKDFVGLKPLGFHTIRVLTGPYRNVKVSSIYEADLIIKDLSKLQV